jgi:hypothetical protein
MTFKVTPTTNSYSVKLGTPKSYKVDAISGGIQVPAKFSDLIDFDPSGLNDSYVIMYDAVTQTYKTVNPDIVLSKAATEPISPGLPADFEAVLDVDLDNKIDLDAGTF